MVLLDPKLASETLQCKVSNLGPKKKCWGTYLIYQSWTWLPLPPSILQLYLFQGKAGIPYPLP